MKGEKIPSTPIATSIDEVIPGELIYPSGNDKRFGNSGAVTIYQTLDTKLVSQGNTKRLPDAVYKSTDELTSQFGFESIETAEVHARAEAGSDTTPFYFERMLCNLFGREISLQHMAVEVVGEVGIVIHNYGFQFKPSS